MQIAKNNILLTIHCKHSSLGKFNKKQQLGGAVMAIYSIGFETKNRKCFSYVTVDKKKTLISH